MRKFAIALFALAVACPAIAFAGAPLTGAWSTTDLGGPIPSGRYTEGWTTGGAMLAGTTLNAASWDGAVLGGMWSYSCATEFSDAELVDDSVVAGNGTRTWKKSFNGGTIWLSGAGPWGNGDASYSGPIISYTEYETLTYVGGTVIAARTNVNAVAEIDGYESSCLGFSVGNGAKVGDTTGGMLANYPALLTTSCSPGAPNGAFWNFSQMTLYIANCAVGEEATSWSSVKAMFR